jgi:hypothetical protein
MKVNKISKDIYEIEDFITIEEQALVLDFASSLKEEDWWSIPNEEHSEEYKLSFFYGKQYNKEMPLFFIEINKKVWNLFESDSFFGRLSFQRYLKEAAIREHRDYWLYDLPYHIRYGVCLYYNDNYDGGELFYPELDIVHKPKARSLVMHGGNILHTNLPVTSDSQRYFSTAFVRGSKDNPVVLNKELFSKIEEDDGSEYR